MGRGISARLKSFTQELLSEFTYEIVFKDWTGDSYSRGQRQPHWKNCPLTIEVRTEAAARDIISLDGLGVLERFLAGDTELSGNLYLIADFKNHTKAKLGADRTD